MKDRFHIDEEIYPKLYPCRYCGSRNMVSLETLIPERGHFMHSLRCDDCGYETALYDSYAEAYDEWVLK